MIYLNGYKIFLNLGIHLFFGCRICDYLADFNEHRDTEVDLKTIFFFWTCRYHVGQVMGIQAVTPLFADLPKEYKHGEEK
ncbi:Uncharacterised protein [Chlamydia trachomatis]|nr:Uncharacterised protein [Chlamydia trachomatis]